MQFNEENHKYDKMYFAVKQKIFNEKESYQDFDKHVEECLKITDNYLIKLLGV
jgi:hypothetical protein